MYLYTIDSIIDTPASTQKLNRHYASISTDPHYESPSAKQSVSPASTTYVTEWHVFKALERRRSTATGLDSLPSWFLMLGAPIFSKPLAQLFNMSVASSTVPEQWKQAYIMPVPKVTHPKALADFRPISITPVLTRIMERLIVTQFLYPAFTSPSKTPQFSNQYAFRLTGSPTSAIISLLHTVTYLLIDNPYVIVISLDLLKSCAIAAWRRLELRA